MFFPEKIKSIKPTDRVLEVGPGGTPFYRADVFLEKSFSEEELNRQRGNTQPLETDKEVIYYDGGAFPFKDHEFDYVVCSHVLEHIPSDEVDSFCRELQRVAKKGYLEFPTIYYEYLYNFDVHLNLMNFKDGTVIYMPKEETALDSFLPIHNFFLKTLQNGYTEIVDNFQTYHFKGFEWFESFSVRKVDKLGDLVEMSIALDKRSQGEQTRRISFVNRLKRRLRNYL